MITVYGIPNCNTVKKAIDWLKQHQVEYTFHDFKKAGITTAKLEEWHQKAGYESFLNKQGLTWKQLDTETKAGVQTAADALQLLQQKTSMIKRPVIESGHDLIFGFNEDVYQKNLVK